MLLKNVLFLSVSADDLYKRNLVIYRQCRLHSQDMLCEWRWGEKIKLKKGIIGNQYRIIW